MSNIFLSLCTRACAHVCDLPFAFKVVFYLFMLVLYYLCKVFNIYMISCSSFSKSSIHITRTLRKKVFSEEVLTIYTCLFITVWFFWHIKNYWMFVTLSQEFLLIFLRGVLDTIHKVSILSHGFLQSGIIAMRS